MGGNAYWRIIYHGAVVYSDNDSVWTIFQVAIMFDDPFERAEEERLELEREELRQCEIRKARIALSMLQPLQRERLMKNVCCGLSSRVIAKQEGVYYSSVGYRPSMFWQHLLPKSHRAHRAFP